MRRNLLRLATAGSVDDGKSTLIGRLLYDSKTLFDDQLATIERVSTERGGTGADLALVTDGLRAEREQGITIDVAYRYVTTPRRKFVIADTPGHVQYTRNMVTGASTADLALILVDARTGVSEQTRRHAFLATLLGVPHLVVCVNKMDLVDWSQERFEEIRAEFAAFAAKLTVGDLSFVPMSALLGDNVVDGSEHLDWYPGPPLLRHLEDVHIASDRNLIDARLPIQYVIRAQEGLDHRSYAGTIAGGIFKPGDEVVVLPAGRTSQVKQIWGPGGTKVEEAFTGMAVSLTLDDDIDVGRGDLLARPGNRPHIGTDLDAMVCWFSEDSQLREGAEYLVRTAAQTSSAQVTTIDYRLDVNTLHRVEDVTTLSLNDIARVRLRSRHPLLSDPYRENRRTGSFILIDPVTDRTVAAGMVTGRESGTDSARGDSAHVAPAVVWHRSAVSRAERGHAGTTVWLTGLSGSGKSSLAVELERQLVAAGRPAYLLDGDNLRHGLNAGLGFSPADRDENVRRVAEVAALFADSGAVAIVSVISPFAAQRAAARTTHADRDLPFHEVFVDTPLAECERRDAKGLYAKARAGELPGFTGIGSPYERPDHADLVITPELGTPTEIAAHILRELGIADR
ncbi:adenylyl-sulfate kinase [Nocardia alba]|uniref:Adenylyl-sulfate kinase n=1 Tax=Nocardia alba TaxID=225051 RepID=A0A4R1FTI8_9NOCA|nr:adenylyl-sulfate kinase [Nocardia alba]TCJ96899.1 adenylylsulfate kinase /sulfate adenylyltransferase subunit 1 [Nocardia alba]